MVELCKGACRAIVFGAAARSDLTGGGGGYNFGYIASDCTQI